MNNLGNGWVPMSSSGRGERMYWKMMMCTKLCKIVHNASSSNFLWQQLSTRNICIGNVLHTVLAVFSHFQEMCYWVKSTQVCRMQLDGCAVAVFCGFANAFHRIAEARVFVESWTELNCCAVDLCAFGWRRVEMQFFTSSHYLHASNFGRYRRFSLNVNVRATELTKPVSIIGESWAQAPLPPKSIRITR